MKKILIALFAIAFIAVVAAGFYSSYKVKEMFNRGVAATNHAFHKELPILTMKVGSYEKSHLTSRARTIFELNGTGYEKLDSVKIGLIHEIYHGPFMITPDGLKVGASYIVTKVDQNELSQHAKEFLNTLFHRKEPIIATMHIGFDNEVHLAIRVEAINLDSKMMGQSSHSNNSDFKLDFDGLTFEFSSNVGATDVNGEIEIGAINIEVREEAEQIFSLYSKASTIKFDVDELYKGIILQGNFVMNVPRLTLKGSSDSEVILEPIVFSATSSEKNDKYEGVMQFLIENLKLKSPQLGAELPNFQLDVQSQLSGIEVADLKNIIDANSTINQSLISMLKDSNLKVTGDELTQQYTHYFKNIGESIKQGLTFTNQIELRSSVGKSRIDFNLYYSSQQRLVELNTLMDLASSIDGLLKISVNKKMIEKTPLIDLIGFPVSMGIAIDTSDSYEAAAALNGGVLSLNGNPWPLFQMMGPALNQTLPWKVK